MPIATPPNTSLIVQMNDYSQFPSPSSGSRNTSHLVFYPTAQIWRYQPSRTGLLSTSWNVVFRREYVAHSTYSNLLWVFQSRKQMDFLEVCHCSSCPRVQGQLESSYIRWVSVCSGPSSHVFHRVKNDPVCQSASSCQYTICTSPRSKGLPSRVCTHVE